MKSKEIGGKPKRNLWTIREELVQAINELDFLVQQKWPAVSITLTMS